MMQTGRVLADCSKRKLRQRVRFRYR